MAAVPAAALVGQLRGKTRAAGKDRNERDDTVYQGERGRLPGFLASQEGWLTVGESGITGVSRDRIFEFPREERRRKRQDGPVIPAGRRRAAKCAIMRISRNLIPQGDARNL